MLELLLGPIALAAAVVASALVVAVEGVWLGVVPASLLTVLWSPVLQSSELSVLGSWVLELLLPELLFLVLSPPPTMALVRRMPTCRQVAAVVLVVAVAVVILLVGLGVEDTGGRQLRLLP